MWAQRKDKLFLTIDVQNCKDPKIAIENDDSAKSGKVTFRGTAQSHATGPEEHQYVLDLELNGEINPDDVKQITTDRTITLLIAKKEEGPHWPRLLKQTGKTPQYVKADWDKWMDEDDEEEQGDDEAGGMGGLDPAMMQQFQNMQGGGMGGMGGGGGMGGLEAMLAGMGGGGGGGAGGMPGMPPGMQGFDMSQLGDMAAGMGGGEESDEDDDEDDMPALEPANK
ncbi:hypothetical protein Ndes2526B_g09083 [Nannochloris sp. 'desiccata']